MNRFLFLSGRSTAFPSSVSLWLRPVLTVVGALLYIQLFGSMEGAGLNVILFDLVLLISSRLLDREQWQNNFTWLSGWGLLLAGICVVLVHNTWARVIHNLYLLVFIGYIQRRELRFLFFGFLLGLWSLSMSHFSFFKSIFDQLRLKNRVFPRAANLWLLVLPVLIIIPFYLLYFRANSAFAEFFQRIYQLFSFNFHFNLDVISLFYFTIGFILCCAVLYPAPGQKYWLKWQKRFGFELTRKRNQQNSIWSGNNPILALKREYQIAVISMLSLNFLLLIANAADLRFLWFDFGDKSPAELSQYVHTGTWSLISSIVLAMVVLLIFFRQNLNFYPNSFLLRKLAYVWLAQNAWLALGVGLRNGFYIQHYGLAHGRIVVVVFLVLVLLGLWTLYLKIAKRKTLYFVLQSNAWAAMLTLLLTAAINWDVLITRYNIHATTQQGIDLRQLERELSDQNTFLLIRHRQQLYGKFQAEPIEPQYLIEQRGLNRRMDITNYTNKWKTWNWPDERNRRALQGTR